MDTLRQQVMINQFVVVTGCNHDEAEQLLSGCNWKFQQALSVFFTESSCINSPDFHSDQHDALSTPANTPTTPSNFMETLAAFSKLSTNSGLFTDDKSDSTITTNSSVNNIYTNNNKDQTLTMESINVRQHHLPYGIAIPQPYRKHHQPHVNHNN